MVKPPDIFKGSLARKLIIAVTLIIIIGGGISWYVLISKARNNLINSAIEHTAAYSDLIIKSTRYSMLTFHRDAIQQTIENIGSKKDIERIRIFDGRGKVFYSSRHEKIGELVDSASFVCVGCHTDPDNPLKTLTEKRQWTINRGENGYRIMTFVTPIYNEPSCYTAACHIHPREQRVLVVLETDISLHSVDTNIQYLIIETTVNAIVFMFVSSIILYFILRKLVVKPVSNLSEAMKKVADGGLNHTITINSDDEISKLADSFNVMTRDLAIAREKIGKWTQTLEEEVAKKTEELRRSQEKLIQAEKLASLGRLTSDIAHEIRNPLTAVGGFARRLYKIVSGEKEKECAEVVITEVNRLERILSDVLTFSRDARFHLERHDITEVVFDTLNFYENMCNERSIKIKLEKEENLPAPMIDKDQVRQALSNLVSNAIDVMPDGGTLTVAAGKEDIHFIPYIFLKVSDTGQGISEEKLPFIFEPFFSTKELHGTGLGLSITRKIIEEHGGFINAESTPGEGSTISLFFPYQSEEASSKIKCWEYMKCGRDKDDSIKCSSYPNFGRVCWGVAGTFCEGKVQGTFAQKYQDCRKCKFYQSVRTVPDDSA